MAYNYTNIDGQRVETAVARAYAALEAEFRRVWGLGLIISSGTRTRAEQQHLYNLYLSGRGNLAAKPGQSNHEEYGPRGPRALDVRDSGHDAGVTVRGSRRANWLLSNAARFGFDPAGYRFIQKEPWHIEFTGALDNGAIPASGTLVVDGEWGQATTAKLQSVLGVPVDGQLGPVTISALQRGLGVTVDGEIGPETVSALQRKVGAGVDGQLGPNTVRALQIYLNNGGRFSPENGQLQVDGQWGPATTRKLQQVLGVTDDGELGPVTIKALQAALGQTQDGQLGPITIKALQMNVGASVDGALGPETIRKLQGHLNAGKAFTAVTVEAPAPAPAATPRTPVYPSAARAWSVPLSRDRDAGSVVNRLIVHHQASTNDDEEFFKTENSRSSCPTWQVKTDGTAVEFISPDKRPSSTGTANTYSVAIETQNTTGAPTWGISPESHETIAQIAAWLSQQTEINGVPVAILLDRDHIIGHNEAGVNATACPGPSMNLDWIVARSREIAGQAPVPEPQPEPEEPNAGLIGQIKTAYIELGKLIDKLEEL